MVGSVRPIMRFEQTLHVVLKPAPSLLWTSWLLHGLVGMVVLYMGWWRPWLVWTGVPVLCLSAVIDNHLLSGQHKRALARLYWTAQNRIDWYLADGSRHTGRCLQATCWGRFWVRLQIQEQGRRLPMTIWLPWDAVDFHTHRHLRARCRLMPPQKVAQPI